MSKIKDMTKPAVAYLATHASNFLKSKAGTVTLVPVQFVVGFAIPTLVLSFFVVVFAPQLASSFYSNMATHLSNNGSALTRFLIGFVPALILVAGFILVAFTYRSYKPLSSTKGAMLLGILVGLGLTSTFVMTQLFAFQAVLAFMLSFVAISATFIIATSILSLEKTNLQSMIKGVRNPSFVNVLRADDWYPSLALFQFLLWTVVIGFSYLSIFFIRIQAGVTDPYPTIPANLLGLMGISVAVPVANSLVSDIKYKTEKPKMQPNPLPKFSTMLMEGTKPSLTRFQMFAWTWVGVTIYLTLVFTEVASLPGSASPESISMPTIDSTLVGLMGLSQTAYLGGKITAKQTMTITDVVPRSLKGQTISILGSGFGRKRDTIWFGEKRLTGDSITRWENNRIDFTPPPDVVVELGKIVVAKGGDKASPTVA